MDTDWGYYSRNNSDCSFCQSKCTAHSSCIGVECGLTINYCSWWKRGSCARDAERTKENKINYSCFKRGESPSTTESLEESTTVLVTIVPDETVTTTQVPEDPCGSYCENDGTCIVEDNLPRCSCPENFSGATCHEHSNADSEGLVSTTTLEPTADGNGSEDYTTLTLVLGSTAVSESSGEATTPPPTTTLGAHKGNYVIHF